MRKEDQSPVHHVPARASGHSRAGDLWHRIGCAELGDETAATGQAPRFAAVPFMPIAEWCARTNMLSIISEMQARPAISVSISSMPCNLDPAPEHAVSLARLVGHAAPLELVRAVLIMPSK